MSRLEGLVRMFRIHVMFLFIMCSLGVSACNDETADTNNNEPLAGSGEPIIHLDAATNTAASGGNVETKTDTGQAGTIETTVPVEADSTTNSSAGINDTLPIYEGFEEQYIMTNEDDPVDVCRVRYELHVVGAPSIACTECLWSVVLERRNPNIITDVDNACAESELLLDDAAIAASVGQQVSYGYIKEFVGHSNVLMFLDEALGKWDAMTFANWSDETNEFSYDRRDGFCSYGGSAGAYENSGICGLSGEAVVSNQ